MRECAKWPFAAGFCGQPSRTNHPTSPGRLPQRLSSAEVRATYSGFAGKGINQGMSTSPCKVTDPRRLESAATEWTWLHCSGRGCESGRQDSNLRPLVPQTSPRFRGRNRVQNVWFRGGLVGMTTSASAMESIGIPSTHTHTYCTLLPPPPPLGAVGRAEPLKSMNPVTGHSCERRGYPSRSPELYL